MSTSTDQEKGAGHRQRLREKFQTLGIDAFSDEEIIELLLILGTPRRDCKQSARAALKQFGSLAAVLEAPATSLSQIPGIGSANSFVLHFVHGAARRYLKHRLEQKNYVSSSREVADYLQHAMRDLPHEVLTAIYLDAGHAIITSETVATGTITVNTVYPRELIKRALHHNAAALVIAHNHPSGSLNPSRDDLHLTGTLYLACTMMHIQLLDHLIVGKGERPYSFADHGLMQKIRADKDPLLAGR